MSLFLKVSVPCPDDIAALELNGSKTASSQFNVLGNPVVLWASEITA